MNELRHNDGSTYFGEVLDGVPHGHGYRIHNGVAFHGTFEHSSISTTQPLGRVIFPSNVTFCGHWKGGESMSHPSVTGTVFLPDGTPLEGCTYEEACDIAKQCECSVQDVAQSKIFPKLLAAKMHAMESLQKANQKTEELERALNESREILRKLRSQVV